MRGSISIRWDEERHKPDGVKIGSEVYSICMGPQLGDEYLEWIVGETMLVFSWAIEHVALWSLTFWFSNRIFSPRRLFQYQAQELGYVD